MSHLHAYNQSGEDTFLLRILELFYMMLTYNVNYHFNVTC